MFADEKSLKLHCSLVHNLNGQKLSKEALKAAEALKTGGRKKTSKASDKKKKSPNKCPICKKVSTTSGNLRQHIKSVHAKVAKFNCDQCDYSGYEKSNIRQHMIDRHADIKYEDRAFKCRIANCSKNFKQKSSLSQHQKIHGKKTFSLDIFHSYSYFHFQKQNHSRVAVDETSRSKLNFRITRNLAVCWETFEHLFEGSSRVSHACSELVQLNFWLVHEDF